MEYTQGEQQVLEYFRLQVKGNGGEGRVEGEGGSRRGEGRGGKKRGRGLKGSVLIQAQHGQSLIIPQTQWGNLTAHWDYFGPSFLSGD